MKRRHFLALAPAAVFAGEVPVVPGVAKAGVSSVRGFTSDVVLFDDFQDMPAAHLHVSPGRPSGKLSKGLYQITFNSYIRAT